MHSTLGRSLLIVLVLAASTSGLALLMVGQSKTEARTEPLDTPSTSVVDLAHDQLRSGQVWEGAATALGELRTLPATADFIDQALPLMQLLAFSMSSLMSDDELQAFVKELDPAKYPADHLALMSFYHEFGAWEPGRQMSFISQDDFWTYVDGLTEDENALVRMGALLFQAYQTRDLSKKDGRTVAVDVVNSMADECADCRVTREMFRVLLRRAMWRTTEDSEAKAEGVYPEAIAQLLLDAPWNEKMKGLMSKDAVVQTIFGIFNSKAVSAATSKNQALAALITAAIAESKDNADGEVRSWLRSTLSPCVAAGMSYSAFGEQVRGAMKGMAAPGLEKAREKNTLDTSRAQYTLFTKSFRLPDGEVDTANLDSLLAQKREEEPVEINYFAKIPMETSYYGHALVNKRKYAEAVAVFQRLIDAYPDSDLARRSQETIDVLQPLCK